VAIGGGSAYLWQRRLCRARRHRRVSAQVSGSNSVALGASANSSGASSVAVGDTARSVGSHAAALGFNTRAAGSYSTAAGGNAQALGDNSIAIGGHATQMSAAYVDSTASNAIAIGTAAQPTAAPARLRSDSSAKAAATPRRRSGATARRPAAAPTPTTPPRSASTATRARAMRFAVGGNAVAHATCSVAIGPSAQATATNAVALGSGSIANVADTVSIGSVGSERKLLNLASGIAPGSTERSMAGRYSLDAGGQLTAPFTPDRCTCSHPLLRYKTRHEVCEDFRFRGAVAIVACR
jgi:trimeric autotransporter adhesin